MVHFFKAVEKLYIGNIRIHSFYLLEFIKKKDGEPAGGRARGAHLR